MPNLTRSLLVCLRRPAMFACLLGAILCPLVAVAQADIAPAAGPGRPMAQMKAVPVSVNPPPKPIFDPRTYGAKGDGVTKDTVAIQKALDTCAAAGGGSVLVSDGIFLTGSLPNVLPY